MHFLNRHLDYATYAYYSSAFTRKNLPQLFKPSFYINFPLFYTAFWLLLEGILENNLVEDSVVEIAGEFMNFLVLLGIALSMWLVPKNHLKIYQDIVGILNVNKYLPAQFNIASIKKFTINIKYVIAQIFYTSTSAYIFFILTILSFFVFFLVFGIAVMTAAMTSNITFIILGFMSFFSIYVVFYAMSFGLPCFLPIILLFHNSWGNRGFVARTAKLGMKYLKYVILLFSLEALIKAFSVLIFFLLISNLENISFNFEDANVFDQLPNLIETSFLKEKIKIFLVLIFWGVFNIIWDVLKASFISYLFVHHYQKSNVDSTLISET